MNVQQQNPDGSWSPAQELPFMCEKDDCDCLEGVKAYKPLPEDTDELDEMEIELGWGNEPVYLCHLHAYGHEAWEEES